MCLRCLWEQGTFMCCCCSCLQGSERCLPLPLALIRLWGAYELLVVNLLRNVEDSIYDDHFFSFSDTAPLSSVIICCIAVATLYMWSREDLVTLGASPDWPVKCSSVVGGPTCTPFTAAGCTCWCGCLCRCTCTAAAKDISGQTYGEDSRLPAALVLGQFLIFPQEHLILCMAGASVVSRVGTLSLL